jgi:peroxiredoxin
MTHDPYTLPEGLAVPEDDGACDHLEGTKMPDVTLFATDGSEMSLRRGGLAVFYVYPKSGRPGVDPPPEWNETPGMRGCTPQSCAFRDHHAELVELGAEVFGVSTQTSAEQQEFAGRLELPYPLLSDEDGLLGRELGLPLVDVTDRLRVYRRVTLVTRDGVIRRVFYPVFPPDANAAEVVAWLAADRIQRMERSDSQEK